MQSIWKNERQRGVSLLESLLATAIAAVLGAAAVPALTEAQVRQQLGATTSDLFAAFNLARTEAIRRGSAVAVKPADGADWSGGWRVFADRNDNGVQDDGEESLLERLPAAKGLTITPRFGATYPGRVLSYDPQGRLHRPGKAGLVIGRLELAHRGLTRSLCFASLGVRIAPSTACE